MCLRTELSFRPIAAAMSHTLLPSANAAATRLSVGVRPRVDVPLTYRLDDQHQRGDPMHAELHLPNAHEVDV